MDRAPTLDCYIPQMKMDSGAENCYAYSMTLLYVLIPGVCNGFRESDQSRCPEDEIYESPSYQRDRPDVEISRFLESLARPHVIEVTIWIGLPTANGHRRDSRFSRGSRRVVGEPTERRRR